MANCDPQDVKLLISTELEPNEIQDLIAIADNRITRMLGGGSLSTANKKEASMMLTAAMIAERSPGSYRVGDVTVDNQGRAKTWRREAKKIVMSSMKRLQAVDPLEET